jgi:hypothetical protein
MPLREFTDPDRRVWQVWDTVPKNETAEEYFAHHERLLDEAKRGRPWAAGAPPATPPRFTEGREHGWLTFMCADEKRRLSPIPDHWADASDTDLAGLLARAVKVPRTAGLNL